MNEKLEALIKSAEVTHGQTKTNEIKEETVSKPVADVVRELELVLAYGLHAVKSSQNDYDLPESALDVMAGVAAMKKSLEEVVKPLVARANDEYEKLIEANPGKKTLPLRVPGASVKAYTPKAVYEYPEDIVEAEELLKVKKTMAVKKGLAKRVETVFDPAVNKLFSITAKPVEIPEGLE